MNTSHKKVSYTYDACELVELTRKDKGKFSFYPIEVGYYGKEDLVEFLKIYSIEAAVTSCLDLDVGAYIDLKDSPEDIADWLESCGVVAVLIGETNDEVFMYFIFYSTYIDVIFDILKAINLENESTSNVTTSSTSLPVKYFDSKKIELKTISFPKI